LQSAEIGKYTQKYVDNLTLLWYAEYVGAAISSPVFVLEMRAVGRLALKPPQTGYPADAAG